MNPAPPPLPSNDPEARITALLLGELSPAEADAVRAELARDPELARLHDRLRETIDLLRATYAQPTLQKVEPAGTPRLSPARREQVLKAFRTVGLPVGEPAAMTPARRVTPWYLPMSLAAAVVALLGALALWPASLAKSKGRKLAYLSEFESRGALSAPAGGIGGTRLATNRPVPASGPLPEDRKDAAQGAGRGYFKTKEADAAKNVGELSAGFGGGVPTVEAPPPPAAQQMVSPDLPADSLAAASPPVASVAAVEIPISKPALAAQAELIPPPPARMVRPGSELSDLNRLPEPTVVAPPAKGIERQVEQDLARTTVDQLTRANAPASAPKSLESPVAAPLLAQRDEVKLHAGAVANSGAGVGGIAPTGGAERELVEAKARYHFFTESNAAVPSFGDTPQLGYRFGRDADAARQKAEAPAQPAAGAAPPSELKEVFFYLADGSADAKAPAQAAEGEASRKLARWDFLWAEEGRRGDATISAGRERNLALAKEVAGKQVTAGQSLHEQLQRVPSESVPQLNQVQPPEALADSPVASRPAPPPSEPQPEVATADNPVSTFSLNVSDVSFKLAGAALEGGVMPDRGSIRSEEFVNALDYRDPLPGPGRPVAFHWERARYPFAHNRDLLRFSVKTAARGREAGRPLNLVLCLDNSGSMERADRVATLREALRVLATQLTPHDRISVVTFARTARLWVDGLGGDQSGGLADQVASLTPQGGTNLEDALRLAYETAHRHYRPDGINRVVLLTDGAANLGEIDPTALKQNVENRRRQGIALDCFGVGWECYNDDLLESLSRNGDGRYGFVNSPSEAASGFASQLAGALQVSASDVKVQVEFNPRRVTAYRQVGYQKHQLTQEQFRDNTVDAAELGAAEAGNALYVAEINPAGEGPIGTARVRFKVPGTDRYEEHEWLLDYTGPAPALADAPPTLRLAASAGAFAEWLAANPHAAEVTPDALLGLLRGVPEHFGADPRPTRLEWMLRQAKSISGK